MIEENGCWREFWYGIFWLNKTLFLINISPTFFFLFLPFFLNIENLIIDSISVLLLMLVILLLVFCHASCMFCTVNFPPAPIIQPFIQANKHTYSNRRKTWKRVEKDKQFLYEWKQNLYLVNTYRSWSLER